MIHGDKKLMRAFDKAKWRKSDCGSVMTMDKRFKSSQDFLKLLSNRMYDSMAKAKLPLYIPDSIFKDDE